MTLSPGQILNNRYRIVNLLGQGGFGAVYRAWDTNLDCPRALKENLDTTPEAQRQFKREAQILGTLSHPNLPHVIDHFIIPGQGQYLVMDFVEGQDLQEMLNDRGGPLPEDKLLIWISQVCDALIYLHSQKPPIIHRDIKPANIKITPDGRAMLVDFGVAKVYDPQLRTTMGARAVTPGYSPNEQYISSGLTDARTDIYALGATLYTLLTGKVPAEAPERNMGKALPAPHMLNPMVSPGVDGAILKAMAMLPEDRFQSAEEFNEALNLPPLPAKKWVWNSPMQAKGTPITAPVYHAPATPAPVSQVLPPSRSLPWGWMKAVGIILVLVFILTWVFIILWGMFGRGGQLITTIQTNTPAPLLSRTPTPAPSDTLFSTATKSVEVTLSTSIPTLTATPLPNRIELKGIRYERQLPRWNINAPAILSMALSFWGWAGDQNKVGPFLMPNEKDNSVMSYELADYVNGNTECRLVTRVGGDPDMLKRLLAAGFPVVVEKGDYLTDQTGVVSWMGHYQVINGYDENGSYFIAQDSLVKADLQVPYDSFIKAWRSFNYTYIVIYSPDKETELMNLLGSDADETVNYQNAALKASNEVDGLMGIDQYFAWYNRGSSLVELQDYAGAAAAYDQSYAMYATIPEAERPWRILWYQTGPYWAYYYSQRYYDTLYLADGTLNAMPGEKNLEESYYWHGMAKAALGDTAGAIEDFKTSLIYNPGFKPSLDQLKKLGVEP